MSANTESKPKPKAKAVDLFELMVAIVIGLAAVGGAWAGYQANIWSGNQVTSFSTATNMLTEASRMITRAESYRNKALQTATNDRAIDLRVLVMLREINMLDEDDPVQRARINEHRQNAKYMLTQHLSRAAYLHLGLPAAMHQASAAVWQDMTEAQLEDTFSHSLDEDFYRRQLKPSDQLQVYAEQLQAAAEDRFRRGRLENYHGDQFTLTGVLFTVCLFLGGIGLVFKSRIRWAFGCLSMIAMIIGMADLFTNKWTKPSPPEAIFADANAQTEEPPTTIANRYRNGWFDFGMGELLPHGWQAPQPTATNAATGRPDQPLVIHNRQRSGWFSTE